MDGAYLVYPPRNFTSFPFLGSGASRQRTMQAMTPATLRNYTAKDLAQIARQHGVPGWHSMRKDQLIRALTERPNGTKSASQTKSALAATRTVQQAKSERAEAAKKANPQVQERISALREQIERAKNPGRPSENGEACETDDRLVVMVRDPYWLHAYWELNQSTVQRMRAALGRQWHLAKPVLRLFEVVDTGTATPSDVLLRTIEIHGGVTNWYIDVKVPASTYRLEIGYVTDDGQFHPLARSNSVTTPAAMVRNGIDANWTDIAANFDKIYALSGGYSPEGTSQELRELLEERLRRPMGTPVSTRFGAGACNILQRNSTFHFDADAEMVIFGSTRPGSHVTLKGEPVQLRDDGTFTVRVDMPNRRQVIPIVASSGDGIEQHTIVVAVERNTKRMEANFGDSTE